MNEEFYIGEIFEDVYPPEASTWCNQNNAFIDVIGEHKYEIKEIPSPTIDEKKAAVRIVRDEYINGIEWRVSRYRDQVELEIPTADTHETYVKILQYMQYLRDYPESTWNWYENNPLTFDEWNNEN